MSGIEVVIIIAAMTFGALVQGSTGIGFTLMAGPAVLAIEPAFAPGPFLVVGGVVSARNAFGDREHLDKRAFKRSLLGLPVGLAAGLGVLSLVPQRQMALLVGLTVCVLTAVLLLGARPTRSPATDVATGAACCFTAVTAGLPGPPLVIGFHDMAMAELRVIAGSFVSVVVAASLLSLVAAGRFGQEEIELSLLGLPGTALGLLLARWARPWFDHPRSRSIVLSLAFLGGLALIIRQL